VAPPGNQAAKQRRQSSTFTPEAPAYSPTSKPLAPKSFNNTTDASDRESQIASLTERRRPDNDIEKNERMHVVVKAQEFRPSIFEGMMKLDNNLKKLIRAALR